MKKYNPKALDIDSIRNTERKVTLGFKCSPYLKIELAEKAEAKSMSLSEYVEGLVVNLPVRNLNLRKMVDDLEGRLSHYEDNPILIGLLDREFGKEYEIQTADGGTRKIKIQYAKDIFDLMVNSFKSQ